MPLFRGSKNATTLQGQIVATPEEITEALNSAIAAKNDAEAAELAAELFSQTAENAESGAVDAQGYAEEWATADEDTPVSSAAGGDDSTTFSALHHAAKAAADAATAAPVANIVTEIDTVAGIETEIKGVYSDLASAAFVIDLGLITEGIDVPAGAGDGNIVTVADNITEVAAVGTNITDVTTVSSDLTGTDTIGTVATNISNVQTVSTDIASVNTAADNITAIQNAPQAASDAEDAQGYAEEWANKSEDTLVSTAAGGDGIDDFSSLHHAKKSSASASNAANSETAAANSASAAATSESNAASSASAAATFESNAATSESNAATSASNAATSETNAANSASAAATSETNAAQSETNAASSASAAATSESNAATSATNASNSASAAATSETNAANSASAAATSETNAANSASAAATSESNAQTAATDAETALDNFTDQYLGAKSSAPTTDNDGDPLVTGALYYNTTGDQLNVWNGSSWDPAAFSSGDFVTSFNTRTGDILLQSTDVTNALGFTPQDQATAYDSAEFSTDFAAETTDNLSEGTTNLYYTDTRVRNAVSASGDLAYDSVSGVFSVTTYKSSDFDTDFSAKTTDGLSEGTGNLYYTDARVRGAVSASGSISYDSATGVFSYTERTDSEIRNLFSASGDLSYDSVTGTFSVTTYKSTDFDTDFSGKSTDDLSEGASNLYYTDARVDSHLVGGSGIDYSLGTISHEDTSAQGSVTPSTDTFISGVTLDSFGHVTGLDTATTTSSSPNDATITLSAGSSLTGGGAFTVDQSTNETITFDHADTSTQASVNNSGGNVIQDVTLDGAGHVTGLASTDLDTRYGRIDTTATQQFLGNVETTNNFVLSVGNNIFFDIDDNSSTFMGAPGPNTLDIKWRADLDYIWRYQSDRNVILLDNGTAVFSTNTGLSDGRHKENVSNLSGGLETVKALRPVNFTWKESSCEYDGGKNHVGFIAQEVLPLVPDAVKDFGNYILHKEDLVPHLVAAVQELSREVKELKEQINNGN